jgi:uncharacterized protein (DUF1778 family)
MGIQRMSAIRKSETVTFRIDSARLDTIQQAARLTGKSVTSFVTEVAYSAAQQELLDQRFFKVDAETFAEVEAMLAEPAKVHEELVKLFRSERQWID